jgi:hypothetical protein
VVKVAHGCAVHAGLVPTKLMACYQGRHDMHCPCGRGGQQRLNTSHFT